MNEEIKDEEKVSIVDGLSLKKVFDVIDSLIEQEDMKELKILKDRIIKYKGEIENKIKEKVPIEHEEFKKNLFRNLEKNIFYAIYIKNPEMRKEKIRKTYLWFFDKMQKWNSLDKILHALAKVCNSMIKLVLCNKRYTAREYRLRYDYIVISIV